MVKTQSARMPTRNHWFSVAEKNRILCKGALSQLIVGPVSVFLRGNVQKNDENVRVHVKVGIKDWGDLSFMAERKVRIFWKKYSD